jgi:VirE N-terminal domain
MTVKVSMFADARGQTPRHCDLAAVLGKIRGDRYADRVRHARVLFAAWKAVCPALDSKTSPEAQAYDAFKKTLPAFCVSGTAANRKEPLEHSNLIQADLDKLNGTMEAVREKVKADPHVAFGFVSPSGDGLKLGLRIDGTRHAESFLAAEKYFLETYGCKLDPSVKDRLRLCFISHDPHAWTNANAVPLPLPEPGETFEPTEPDGDAQSSGAALSIIVLPSGTVTISESAREIFQRIAPTHTLFWRGGALVELVTVDGVDGLEVLKPDKFRSDAEKLGRLFAWRVGRTGKPVLNPAKMSLDDAKGILAASESREFLPSVASVLRCAVLTETPSREVAILGRGYHTELGGLLIVTGDTPPQVELREAVEALRWLVDEFDFQDEGDRSRAVAAFITPALRLGGFIRKPIPFDCAEADKSQSGKGHRLEMVSAIYNEKPYLVTAKVGGVGSVDESFQATLISARPFVCLDNFRGKMDSQHLEAFLTCPGLFPARIPHKGEALVDPKRFILQMSSNGLETTRDLANRASICRIRKRPGFQYRETLAELQRRQPYFLGCVFAVVAEWIANGKPRTKDTRHDFREWSQTLDWICQNILGTAPLMDGHEAAQERTSNPALSWLRAVALAVSGENRLGVELTATELVEICDLHAVEIPGKPADEDRAKKQVGCLCKQLFRHGETVNVDGFQIARGRKEYRKPSGDLDFTNAYTFTK